MKTIGLIFYWFVIVILLSNCSVKINDFTACALVPGNYGAVCDNFLTSNPQTLNEEQWQAIQTQWMSQGWATECTTSEAISDIKQELEKLCSVTRCTYEETKILQDLERLENLPDKVAGDWTAH